MREAKGDLWTYPADVRVITTNGTVKKNGECVMGRGCAYEATQKFPGIAKQLGNLIAAHGNHVYWVLGTPEKIFSFPVKHEWHQTADLALIEQSAKELVALVNDQAWLGAFNSITLPRPGCGNGKLKWEDVKPILEMYLDDRFTVITNEGA